MRARHPRLVYGAISGYGHTGPKANRGGYDIIAQGEAGLMALTGPVDGGPSRFPSPMADISGGIYTCMGVLAALYARDNRAAGSNVGQLVDVALVDAQLSWLANIGASYFATGKRPRGSATRIRTSRRISRAGPRQDDDHRRRQRTAVGEVLQDPRRRGHAHGRPAVRDERRSATSIEPSSIALLEQILARRTAAEWVEELVAAGIPAGPINFPDETLTDEHVLARRMIVELEHPLIGVVRSIAAPMRFESNGPTYRRYPPRLGEHNDEIRGAAATW